MIATAIAHAAVTDGGSRPLHSKAHSHPLGTSRAARAFPSAEALGGTPRASAHWVAYSPGSHSVTTRSIRRRSSPVGSRDAMAWVTSEIRWRGSVGEVF